MTKDSVQWFLRPQRYSPRAVMLQDGGCSVLVVLAQHLRCGGVVVVGESE